MKLWYIMVEAVPAEDNEERLEFGGAYINCWVKAESPEAALDEAKAYVAEADWVFLQVMDMFLADRDAYLEIPESLECFDEACEDGISAVFYTWPPDEE